VAETQLDAQKRKEAKARYDNVNRRIAAVDRDIATETDGERVATLREKRDGLAQDREAAMAELTALERRGNGDLEILQRKVSELGHVLASDHPQEAHAIIEECALALARLDNRVLGLEGRVTAIERHIHPPLTVSILRIVAFFVVLLGIALAGFQYPVFSIYPFLGLTVEGALIILAGVILLYANAMQERRP
jgi:hypothetical protein